MENISLSLPLIISNGGSIYYSQKVHLGYRQEVQLHNKTVCRSVIYNDIPELFSFIILDKNIKVLLNDKENTNRKQTTIQYDGKYAWKSHRLAIGIVEVELELEVIGNPDDIVGSLEWLHMYNKNKISSNEIQLAYLTYISIMQN